MGEDGELYRVDPRELNNAEIVSIDSNENSFAEFYVGFYHQLKEPDEFSFFKVKEYEARQTALHLQRYIDDSSDEGRRKLKEYEISIDSVEAYRRAGGEMKGKREEADNNYLYKPKQVNWKMIEKLGLSKKILQELGVLVSILKGYKTDKLVTKPPYLENILSARGTLFNAAVQYNADKRYVEFLLDKNVRRIGMEDFRPAPEVFKGKKLKKWQMEKLKVGEVAYVDGLVDRNGKRYQGYLRFDKRMGKFEFSFKNVWKGKQKQERGKSRKRGRGM